MPPWVNLFWISRKKYMHYTWSLSGNPQVEFDHYIKDEGPYH